MERLKQRLKPHGTQSWCFISRLAFALTVLTSNTACQQDPFTLIPYGKGEKNRYIALNEVTVYDRIHPLVSINCGEDPSVLTPLQQILTTRDSIIKNGASSNDSLIIAYERLARSHLLDQVCND